MEQARQRLETQARVLISLSYEGVLSRGFALVTGAGGALVRSAAVVSEGDALKLRFADGEVTAVAGPSGGGAKRRTKGRPPVEEPPPPPRIRKRLRGTDQGDLF